MTASIISSFCSVWILWSSCANTLFPCPAPSILLYTLARSPLASHNCSFICFLSLWQGKIYPCVDVCLWSSYRIWHLRTMFSRGTDRAQASTITLYMASFHLNAQAYDMQKWTWSSLAPSYPGYNEEWTQGCIRRSTGRHWYWFYHFILYLGLRFRYTAIKSMQ